MPKSIILENS